MNQALAMDEQVLSFPKSKSKLQVYILEVTPKIAQQFLDKNHKNNRKIKPRVVTSYARQMEKGLWKSDNGEGITLDEHGDLANGQHRLHAVIEYGKPVMMMIISGVPEKSIITIDDGITRSLNDGMTIHGKTIPNQSAVNRAITCLFNLHGCTETDLHYESLNSSTRKTNSELIHFFDNLPNFSEVASEFFTKFKYTKVSQVMPLGICLSMYYLFKDDNPEIVFSIFKSFESGIPMDDLRELSPIYYAVQKSQRRKDLKLRIRPWEHIMMFIWVYAKLLEKKPVKKEPTMVWIWSDLNPITEVARKKLKAIKL